MTKLVEMNMPCAVYWGHFDPPTLAHQSIIRSCARRFKKTFIIINSDRHKTCFFSTSQRLELMKANCQGLEDIVSIQAHSSNLDYHSLREKVSAPLIVVSGSDAFLRWQQKSLYQLHDYDGFYIANRQGYELDLACLPNNTNIFDVSSECQSISSNQVRSALKQKSLSKQHLVGVAAPVKKLLATMSY